MSDQPRFEKAQTVASLALDGQFRKISGEAAVNHSRAVSSILLEGGIEDESILSAAMLHDVLEDAPEAYSREAMRQDFGDRIVDLVSWVTENKVDGSGEQIPWLERKQSYVENMRHAPISAVLISAADKIHNLSTVLEDYDVYGDAIWNNFKAGPSQQSWYYSTLLDIFINRLGEENFLTKRLAELNDRLNQILPPDQARS